MATTTQQRLLSTITAATVALLAFALGAGASSSRPALVIGVPGVPPVFLAVRSYVALDRGLYARYAGRDARISLESFATDQAELQAVESGQIALAWVPTPAALSEIARGEPLVAIEGMDAPDWEIGSTDPSITSCSDLKGHTIGIDAVGGARYNALVAMLAACGLSIHDVTTVPFPDDTGMNAQIAGQLTLDVEHYDEVAQVEAMGKSVTIVERLADVDPDEHFEMLVTTEDALASHRALYVKVLEGDIAATRWLYNPAHLAAAASNAQITGESPAVVAAAISHYVGADWWCVNTPGLSPTRIASTNALDVSLGLIPAGGRALAFANVADTSLWEAAQRALG